jgi:hypothetical protein
MDILKAVLFLAVGLTFMILFLKLPKQMFLFYILIKPIVDRFSEGGATLGGVSLGYHYIAALVVPAVAFLCVLGRRKNLLLLPHKVLIFLFIAGNIVAWLAEGNYTLDNAGYYIRVVFPVFLYFSIPFLLDVQEDILRLIRITSVSGIFPTAMIFLQRVGMIAQNRAAEGFGGTLYDRATGGYADSFSAALPIIISVFCVLFLLQHNKEERKKTVFYWMLLPLYAVALAFTFHRMTFVVLALVVLIWIMVNRRVMVGVVLSALALAALPVLMHFLPEFFADIFIRETVHRGGFMEPASRISNATFHGRIGVWTYFLEMFRKAPFFRQAFGIFMAGRAPHNDYLRILITNGFVGLLLYAAMLFSVAAGILSTYLQSRSRKDPFLSHLSLLALFLFLFYFLSGFTLTISLLSTLTWFFWVFTGIVYYQRFRTQAALVPPVPSPGNMPAVRNRPLFLREPFFNTTLTLL